MAKFLKILFSVALLLVLSAKAEAVILTFDTDTTPGLTFSANMRWDGTGGGHLYCEGSTDNDEIYFAVPTLVNDFQMNAMPQQGYTDGNIGFMDICGFDSSWNTLWSSTVDLRGYTSWDNWLSVPVNTAGISVLQFYGPGNTPYYNGFWPSIDNMSINDVVPEPASLSLLCFGLAGFLFKRKTTA